MSKARRKRESASADDAAAAKRRQSLWHYGALFHCTHRYPRKRGAPAVDRLAGILRHGLTAPAASPEGSACSDLNIIVTGMDVAYDGLVFLHRYIDISYIYTMCDPGRFAVFVDPTHPVLTPQDMGPDWPLLCQDEVYVRDRVAVDKLIAVAIHPADADDIMDKLLPEFQRLRLPLCSYDGQVFWSPE